MNSAIGTCLPTFNFTASANDQSVYYGLLSLSSAPGPRIDFGSVPATGPFEGEADDGFTARADVGRIASSGRPVSGRWE